VRACTCRLAQAVRQLTTLLATLERSIADHPPSTESQRYGNLSFRPWSAAALEALPQLVDAILSETHKAFLPHLVPLLTETSPFGNATRLDFGTGHEAAFFLFLYALHRIGVLTAADDLDVGLVVFPACVPSDGCHTLRRSD
jgi:serine/threonine-protein phosphatase 2A activator